MSEGPRVWVSVHTIGPANFAVALGVSPVLGCALVAQFTAHRGGSGAVLSVCILGGFVHPVQTDFVDAVE